jgi:hypothetical protein
MVFRAPYAATEGNMPTPLPEIAVDPYQWARIRGLYCPLNCREDEKCPVPTCYGRDKAV